MDIDLIWASQFQMDIRYGYVGGDEPGTGQYVPRLVMNEGGRTVEHAILEELKRCLDFTFSVAFISSGAIAQLKQHLYEFEGVGRIITSDFLGFNSPAAFAELLKLRESCGIDVRIHSAEGFHPKGYLFGKAHGITAMVGSSNLTGRALSQNHEWNLKVSAAKGSDLAHQFQKLLEAQVHDSQPLTQDWVDGYAETYLARAHPTTSRDLLPDSHYQGLPIKPNSMQKDALLALDFARAEGAHRAIIISATGTGKTMLSALDVKALDPRRLLFVVHREQILDRTIREYQRVLGGPDSDYGKLTGSHKQPDKKYVFATVQTLSQPATLAELSPNAFDYIIVDEAHRSAAETYQRVMDHFRPGFLLGMTATPERTDGSNVYEIFDYNVPYEIRLHHALEAKMLSPFHYYGISDVSFDDGTTVSDTSQLGQLVTPDRVNHLIRALDRYGQAGVEARGLIFCSRKDEARELSAVLNKWDFRGKKLRTVALTGDDSIERREQCVQSLEVGDLDYILTVDVFNEGVDIPSINQVVMLRQTHSAIVFVQQLGRGLRLSEGKDHLVVIDFIGNYTNNFMIPIALFGDETLNREALRERLNETVEAGALSGLSSISFDEVSRERILTSIAQTQLDSLANLKVALTAMRNRVGRTPSLWDFWRFESVDPVLLATKKEHYPALASSLLGANETLDEAQSRALSLLSHEVLAGKRLHEFVLLELLLASDQISTQEIALAFGGEGLSFEASEVNSAVDTLALRGYPLSAQKRYEKGLIEIDGDFSRLSAQVQSWLSEDSAFTRATYDLLRTGRALTTRRYDTTRVFTPGMQYTRADAAHLLGWSRSTASTIYGVKTDLALGVCAIFVTLEKSDEVAASTAYQDQLLDTSTMRWFTKSNRSSSSPDVSPIIEGKVSIHVFVKKDDAEGGNHYYLGKATAHDAVDTTMPGSKGLDLPVVTMLLRFDEPVRQGLFDYFAPEL